LSERRRIARSVLEVGSVAADLVTVKQMVKTSVGDVEIALDEESGVVSVYRFDRDGRPVAGALDGWAYTDLTGLLAAEAGVPPSEAAEIAAAFHEEWLAPRADPSRAAAAPRPWRALLVRAAGAGILTAALATIARAVL
jgi:hypothetical protein